MKASSFLCGVPGCIYIASGAIEDFVVCSLHDSDKTLAILEAGEVPGSYWYSGVPIVLPCGELTEEHFEFAEGEGTEPEEDPRLLEALKRYETLQRKPHSKFDLFS